MGARINHDPGITDEGLRAAAEALRLARVPRTIPTSQLAPPPPRTMRRRAPGLTIGEAVMILIVTAAVIIVSIIAQYGGIK